MVAITGASGYLGSVLVDGFGAAGYGVRRLVRHPAPGSSDRFFDLSTGEAAGDLDDVDLLVHCAYDMTLTSRADIWRVNVFGSVALLDRALAAGVPRVLVVSSMSAYRGTKQLYGRSKLAVEVEARSRGMCVVRPGLVYGSGWGGMAGTLRRLSTLPLLPDFGSAARQFTVSQDDFTSAMVALAGADDLPTVPVGIAHPEAVDFRQLIAAFASGAARPAPHFVPVPPMAVYGALRAVEQLPVVLPVRADSLLGLVRPAPEVPNHDVLTKLGVAVRPFGLETPASADIHGVAMQGDGIGSVSHRAEHLPIHDQLHL